MRVLCYVNHYFGQPAGFEGRSTDTANTGRRQIVEACIAALRALPGAEVLVCGIEGRSLVPIDLDFPEVRSDPKQLIYASLAHMAGRLDDYDYFINVEDDILVPPETFANVLEFDRDSLVNEILHPNRLEDDDSGVPFCVDLKAMPGWGFQRRVYKGREIRVARNPHSGLLIMSRDKLRHALANIDLAYRGRFLVWEMDSAFAYFHSAFALYRPYEDLSFHTVRHLDRWAGTRPKAATAPKARPTVSPRWKRVLRQLLPPIVLTIARRILGRPATARPTPRVQAQGAEASPVAAVDGKMTRHEFLAGLHQALSPATYLEIGVNDGQSLTLSRATTIGVDPAFKITRAIDCDLALVRSTSDEFFAMPDPLRHFRKELRGAGDPEDPTIDLAFIDGMHLFDYAFRDFMNAERHADWWSAIVLDDMLPRDHVEANRDRTTRDWTGDVFKIIPVLAAHRPDLIVLPVDTAPTGVVVVLGADPANDVLRERYDEIIAEWVTPDPQQVPAPILSREGACDPRSLLASPVWATLVRARAAREPRPADLDAIRAILADVARR